MQREKGCFSEKISYDYKGVYEAFVESIEQIDDSTIGRSGVNPVIVTKRRIVVVFSGSRQIVTPWEMNDNELLEDICNQINEMVPENLSYLRRSRRVHTPVLLAQVDDGCGREYIPEAECISLNSSQPNVDGLGRTIPGTAVYDNTNEYSNQKGESKRLNTWRDTSWIQTDYGNMENDLPEDDQFDEIDIIVDPGKTFTFLFSNILFC